MERLRRTFITGLLVLVPITVSVWVLFRLTRFLENILGPLFKNFLKESYVPGVGIVSLVLIIFLVGYLANNFFGRRFLHFLERMLGKIPLFNRIYLTIKGISDSVLGQERQRFFEGVALVPFPNEGSQTIGFITAVPQYLGPDYVGVFVPTPPNIANGFYLIYPKKDVRFLDISVQEGIKLVLSIGLSSRSKDDE